MPSARAFALASLVAAVLALGACGEERGPDGRAPSTSPTPVSERATTVAKAIATVTVSLADFRLDPVNPRVARGGIIAFVATNDGQTAHALAVDGPAGEVSTVKLAPGEQG